MTGRLNTLAQRLDIILKKYEDERLVIMNNTAKIKDKMKQLQIFQN